MEIKAELLKPYTENGFVPLFGYEETHLINKCGVIIRIFKNSHSVLKPFVTRQGYLKFNISTKCKNKQHFAHRLLAQTFIPNPDNLPIINHKNGIKTDNRLENLEWCTYQYNSIHKFKVLKYKLPQITEEGRKNKSLSHIGKMRGKDNHKSRPVICNETNKKYECIRACAEDIKGTVQGIWDVLNGKYNRHRGYTFRYSEVI